MTDTLIERVDKLIQASKVPLLYTTPTSVAVRELAAQTEALENAVRETAFEVQKLTAQGLSREWGGSRAGERGRERGEDAEVGVESDRFESAKNQATGPATRTLFA